MTRPTPDIAEGGHTPLPWRRDGSSIGPDRCTVYIVGGPAGKYPTIFVESLGEYPERLDANADLIIRSVNSHDDLLAACKQLTAAMRQLGKGHHREVVFAESAIASATGGVQ